ncbi:OLC1v1034374C1 [Oldenlandia corymbosa var. corymbosa]|uniref:OLC1v1034374C1 n=1 Tax=Oldenlandia corymbosa var. corymbosa TaxID=529605 RepID=A0AAV1CR56_OLDCO|nr:OLC1v1034374C1 [Oldenlandia corymbosa var. corymbosa]
MTKANIIMMATLAAAAMLSEALDAQIYKFDCVGCKSVCGGSRFGKIYCAGDHSMCYCEPECEVGQRRHQTTRSGVYWNGAFHCPDCDLTCGKNYTMATVWCDSPEGFDCHCAAPQMSDFCD